MLQQFSLFPNNKQTTKPTKRKQSDILHTQDGSMFIRRNLLGVQCGLSSSSAQLLCRRFTRNGMCSQPSYEKGYICFRDRTGRVITDYSYSTQLPSENQNEVGGLEKINSINISEMLCTTKRECL